MKIDSRKTYLFNSVKFGMHSIGTRLFLSVMVAASLGLGVMGYLFYQKLESVKLLQLINETDIKVRKLNSELRSSESFLKSLVATTQFLHANGKQSPEVYDKLMVSFMPARPQLITGFGVMQLPYSLVNRQWFGSYIEESLPNRGSKIPGDPKFSQVELWEVDRYPEMQYYTDAVKADRYFWSEPYINNSYPIALMTFAGPIRDRQGKTIAIMNGDINLKDLTQVKEDPHDDDEYYVLATQNGTLLSYSPDPNQASKLAKITSIPSLKPVWNQVIYELAQGKSQGYLESDTTKSYWVYHKVPASKWVMLQAIPYRSVINPALFGAASSTLIVGIFLAGVVMLFVRRLNSGLQPILNVCDETLKNVDISIKPKDEISCLSQAFFLMVEQQNSLLDQLQFTNAGLLESHRLKDCFLANMSHELRTPLNAILGMTEALQEEVFGNVTPEQIKALQTIERSGSHLLELINDILDVAKIESGQIELDFKNIAIAELCKSSLAFIKQQALNKNIQLEIKVTENLPQISLDERRIRQVIINLLNNAVKFTPSGGRITLTVSQMETTQEKGITNYIRIAVIDTGIGIAPENIGKLFQPFIQIDSSLNRQYEGTGLGLALVKRIVELHGGKVGLTSEEGVGSCFTVDLPCSTNIASKSNDVIEPKLETSSLILVAEDNEANITTISSYLEAKGYRLLIAYNGIQAIKLTKSTHPDLILMDIQMPEMDGIEAMQNIRRDPDVANIPIIAVTALAMTGDKERCLAAGADDYISKPIKLKQLSTTIQNLLSKG